MAMKVSGHLHVDSSSGRCTRSHDLSPGTVCKTIVAAMTYRTELRVAASALLIQTLNSIPVTPNPTK